MAVKCLGSEPPRTHKVSDYILRMNWRQLKCMLAWFSEPPWLFRAEYVLRASVHVDFGQGMSYDCRLLIVYSWSFLASPRIVSWPLISSGLFIFKIFPQLLVSKQISVFRNLQVSLGCPLAPRRGQTCSLTFRLIFPAQLLLFWEWWPRQQGTQDVVVLSGHPCVFPK